MPTKTQAWVVREKGVNFECLDLTLDDPGQGEVLVELQASGICHTDFAVAAGHLMGETYPCILGHEGAGVVKSTGEGVTLLKAGDHVLLSFAYCQKCTNCLSQDLVGCTTWGQLNFGKSRQGGSLAVGTLQDGTRVDGSFFGQSSFGKHALVQESSCVVVPPTVDLVQLAPLGCGMQTGAGSVLNVAKPSPSQPIVIAGLGGVGHAALFAALSLSLETIIVVDVNEKRLEQAKAFGATHALNPTKVDVPAEVFKITKGLGAKYAFECTGLPSVLESIFYSLGYKGELIIIGDNGTKFSLPMGGFLSHFRSIRGVIEGESNTKVFIPQLIKMYQNGQFPLDNISKIYKFEEFKQAVQDMKDGVVIKPILDYR